MFYFSSDLNALYNSISEDSKFPICGDHFKNIILLTLCFLPIFLPHIKTPRPPLFTKKPQSPSSQRASTKEQPNQIRPGCLLCSVSQHDREEKPKQSRWKPNIRNLFQRSRSFPSYRQREPNHEKGTPSKCKNLKGSQRNSPRMRFRVHKLHHR